MEWIPIKEKNAIDRVRVLIQFKDPLPILKLDQISKKTVDNFQKIGFNQRNRAEGTVHEIPIGVNFVSPNSERSIEGWTINKFTDQGNLIEEEAGFRRHVFGYMTTKYERWKNLSDRFWDIFHKPLKDTVGICSVGSIRLEYWNRFIFDGDPLNADISSIISSFDSPIPNDVIQNKSLWHSHVGWFENIESFQTLVQLNIDLNDAKKDKVVQRNLSIFTLIEVRELSETVEVDKIRELLEKMHNKTALVIGRSLTDAVRNKIGMELEEYEQC